MAAWGCAPSWTKVVLEEISKECPALALSIDAHHLATLAIMMFGSKAQKEHYLAKLVNGDLVGESAAIDPAGNSISAEAKPIGSFTADGNPQLQQSFLHKFRLCRHFCYHRYDRQKLL